MNVKSSAPLDTFLSPFADKPILTAHGTAETAAAVVIDGVCVTFLSILKGHSPLSPGLQLNHCWGSSAKDHVNQHSAKHDLMKLCGDF
jgi:hypothetical protein